jgi:hypothetical protein
VGLGSSSGCGGNRSTEGGAASWPCNTGAAINKTLKRINPNDFINVVRNVAEFTAGVSYVDLRGFVLE